MEESQNKDDLLFDSIRQIMLQSNTAEEARNKIKELLRINGKLTEQGTGKSQSLMSKETMEVILASDKASWKIEEIDKVQGTGT